mgnify:CR=1 FL=1
MRNDLITQPINQETYAHFSLYFDNPLLLNGFIPRKLVKGEIWKTLSAIILTLQHATVILLRHHCRWSPCLLDHRKLTFTCVVSHWCQKDTTSIQDGCCAINANWQREIIFSALRFKTSKQEVKMFQHNLDNKPKFIQYQPVFVHNFGKGAKWV